MVKSIDWSETELSIDFETVEINDKTMSLMILCDNKIVWQEKKMPKGLTKWSHSIILPCKISLIFGNHISKLSYTDDSGNVIPHSIKIKSIKLDRMPCNIHYQELTLVTETDDDDLILGDVLCANGKMDLHFNEPTAFHWLVKTQDI